MYKNLDDQLLDDAAKKVAEVVDKASSKMLEKASVDEIAALQSYTIRSLDQQGSALIDVEQYKMLNVKDDPIQAKSRLLNKDPRFQKDPQYIFFLLWQQEMRQISAGIYNVLKSTHRLIDKLIALLLTGFTLCYHVEVLVNP